MRFARERSTQGGAVDVGRLPLYRCRPMRPLLLAPLAVPVLLAACAANQQNANPQPMPGPWPPPSAQPSAWPQPSASASATPPPNTMQTTQGPSATLLNPSAAGAVGLALTAAGATDAPGMGKEGSPLAGNFQEGQVLEQIITIMPGRCYTFIAAGAGPQEMEIQLVAQSPSRSSPR